MVRNKYEMVWAIICMLVSGGIFSFITATVASIVLEIHAASSVVLEQTNVVNRMLTDIGTKFAMQ
jgi:hypothetical protein